MPGRAEILASLAAIANGNTLIAFGWHIAIAIALLRLLGTWRPTVRQSLMALSMLAASVSSLALSAGNPFNGTLFALFAVVGVFCAVRSQGRFTDAQSPAAVAGSAGMILLGLLYPHFLTGRTPLIYFVAAPTGVIPCPTLAVLIGFTLLSPGVFPRLWTGVLVAFGAFYGLFGLFRLGVGIDGLLLIGTGLLWQLTFGSSRHPAGRRMTQPIDGGRS